MIKTMAEERRIAARWFAFGVMLGALIGITAMHALACAGFISRVCS